MCTNGKFNEIATDVCGRISICQTHPRVMELSKAIEVHCILFDICTILLFHSRNGLGILYAQLLMPVSNHLDHNDHCYHYVTLQLTFAHKFVPSHSFCFLLHSRRPFLFLCYNYQNLVAFVTGLSIISRL